MAAGAAGSPPITRRPSDKFTFTMVKARHRHRPEGAAGVRACTALLLDISDACRAGRIDGAQKATLKKMLARGQFSATECRSAFEAEISRTAAAAAAASAAAAAAAVANPGDDPWYVYSTPAGTLYYGCPSRNTSQWKPPDSTNVWRIFTDDAGRRYCHNQATGETKWYHAVQRGKKNRGQSRKDDAPDIAPDLVRALSQEESVPRDVVHEIFQEYDRDGNGVLSVAELQEALFSVGCDLRFSEVAAIFALVDKDGNGVMSSEEFCHWAEESGAFAQWKDEIAATAAAADEGEGHDDNGSSIRAAKNDHKMKRRASMQMLKVMVKHVSPEAHSSFKLGRTLLKQYLPPAQKTCVICGDDACPESEGVTCHSRRHFFCSVCFTSFVQAEASVPLEVRARESVGDAPRKGHLWCPFVNECESRKPFSDADVAKHADDATFQLWMSAKIALLEARISREADARVKLEMQNYLGKSALEKEVHAIRIHIEEEILTIRCPKCRQPFVDYRGCAALTCGTCQAKFCALCLKDCGRDAHQHVKECDLNPQNPKGYFVKVKVFEKIHAKRKRKLLRDYWKDKAADVRTAAAKDPSIQRYFAEHRVDILTAEYIRRQRQYGPRQRINFRGFGGHRRQLAAPVDEPRRQRQYGPRQRINFRGFGGHRRELAAPVDEPRHKCLVM